VSDATLTSLVAELRAAIGDDARAPVLVRTIHGFGYVFCGDTIQESRPSHSNSEPNGSHRINLREHKIALPNGKQEKSQ
jgi:DNA-binding winged helix-turn-helix (wHTH) protein